MALPESAFTNLYWIKYKEGATLSRSNRRRFDYMNLTYGGRAWRNKPQPGYNAQSPAVRPDRINLSTDTPYMRAR